jgi:hypothetical protein
VLIIGFPPFLIIIAILFVLMCIAGVAFVVISSSDPKATRPAKPRAAVPPRIVDETSE